MSENDTKPPVPPTTDSGKPPSPPEVVALNAKKTAQKQKQKQKQEIIKVTGLRVAPGKSVTSRGGILGEGSSIEGCCFHEDPKEHESAVKNLLEKGYLVK